MRPKRSQRKEIEGTSITYLYKKRVIPSFFKDPSSMRDRNTLTTLIDVKKKSQKIEDNSNGTLDGDPNTCN